jgi:hypothetical protein
MRTTFHTGLIPPMAIYRKNHECPSCGFTFRPLPPAVRLEGDNWTAPCVCGYRVPVMKRRYPHV